MEFLFVPSVIALIISALWVIHGPRKDQHRGAVTLLYSSALGCVVSLIALMM